MARRDTRLIYAAGFLRSATVGLTGVVLAIYLSDLGWSAGAIGALLGIGLAGSSAATVAVSLRGDLWGRRRALVVLGTLTAGGYVALAVFTSIAVLIPLAFVGMVNGMGRDRGAASALDQAILPETVSPQRRTWALAWYNLVLDGGHAAGALAGATPTILMRIWQLSPATAHRATFLMCAAVTFVSVVPYVALTRDIEVARPGRPGHAIPLDPRSRRVITRLALLFGLDGVGGGFLNSALIAYWFFQRYATPEADLAVLFFAARLLNAASHLVAAWMARRIGLVKTMVGTHLASSLFLMAAPAAPTAVLAAVLFLAREALVEMDVPTRQSYVMAIVTPAERTFASGVTNTTRTVAWAVGPSIAGVVMQRLLLAGPLLAGGMLKISYDLLLYASFRHLRPPEEQDGPPVRGENQSTG